MQDIFCSSSLRNDSSLCLDLAAQPHQITQAFFAANTIVRDHRHQGGTDRQRESKQLL